MNGEELIQKLTGLSDKEKYTVLVQINTDKGFELKQAAVVNLDPHTNSIIISN